MSNVEIRTGYLPVGIDHQLYFEDVGDPHREALLFLHGGPGLGCEEKHRKQFNLNKYRVILMHQRGSGKSQTQGEINDNTTQHLVNDIEVLRRRLKLEKFSILGSSWGAVPAAIYAAENPTRINSVILKSPFLARKKDFVWGYTMDGVAKLLPAEWQTFSFNGKYQGGELVEKYYRALIHNEVSANERKEWICRWLNWEGAQYFYSRPHEKSVFTHERLTPYWMNVAQIQIHYAKNKFFLDENGILPYIDKIAAAPIYGLCLQGAKDIVTPPSELEELKARWPSLEISLLPEADHKIPEEELLNV